MGLHGVGCESAVVGGERRRGFCQSEVENLHAAIASDEDIFRFQIPVNDALLVSSRQPEGDLGGIFRNFPRGQRAASDAMTQRSAREQLNK